MKSSPPECARYNPAKANDRGSYAPGVYWSSAGKAWAVALIKISPNLCSYNTPALLPTKLGVWSEVKLRYATGEGRDRKSFDYTFDYVLMPTRSVELGVVMRTGIRKNKLLDSGFSLARRDGVEYVEDFPQGDPLVVEIMTSSTSGGNKNKRTTVAQAFEDAVLNGVDGHVAPGINYRQCGRGWSANSS